MSTGSVFRPDVVRNKVALITGGGSGLGFDIALTLGLHGAKIAIMGRRLVLQPNNIIFESCFEASFVWGCFCFRTSSKKLPGDFEIVLFQYLCVKGMLGPLKTQRVP